MSDQHLGELEAAWRASGSVEDEAVWLRARAQAGDLTERNLHLAAYCGHVPAAKALASAVVAPRADLVRLAHGLSGWGPEACVRGLIVLSELVLVPHCPDCGGHPDPDHCSDCAKAGGCVLCHGTGFPDGYPEGPQALVEWANSAGEVRPRSFCELAAKAGYSRLASDWWIQAPEVVSCTHEAHSHYEQAVKDLLGVLQREGRDDEPAFQQLSWERAQEQACRRLRDELVPWALGMESPGFRSRQRRS